MIVKELRQLWPIALLWMGIELIGWTTDLLSVRVDEQSLGNWCAGMCEPGVNIDVATVYLLFGLVTAYSLYPREFSDGTINFLHALPISRLSIFISKLVAAVLVLTLVSALSGLLVHLSLMTNPESLRGGHYPGISIPFLLSDPLRFFVIVAYGIFLSTLRIAGLVLFVGYVFVLTWMETQWQLTGPWNLTEMFRIAYHGQTLILPWEAFGVQLGISAVLLTLAYRIWSRSDAATSMNVSIAGQRPWLNVMLAAIGFVIVCLLAVNTVHRQGKGVSVANTRTVQTDYFHFVFHEHLTDRATRLTREADAILLALVDQIKATEIPAIRANLMTASQHFAGQAAWKTLRMDISGIRDNRYYKHVLGHETVHVLQATESRRKLRTHFNSVRFFIEGSAEYLTFQVLPDPARRNRNWRTAATAAQRLKIDFDDLVDSNRFAEEYDADQFYALGDIWTDALVQACGPAVVGNVLRAFARDGAPPGLTGRALWRNTLQAVDCEITAVNRFWKERITSLAPDNEGQQFPAFREAVVNRWDDQTLVIRASLDQDGARQWPGRFSVRVERRSNLASEPDAVFAGRVIAGQVKDGPPVVEFRVPDSAVNAPRFRYQLGYNPPDTHASIYERWRSASRPQ